MTAMQDVIMLVTASVLLIGSARLIYLIHRDSRILDERHERPRLLTSQDIVQRAEARRKRGAARSDPSR